MIRILIVDDHALVRGGLREILADEPDMTVAGEAANSEEMLAFVRTQPCDIVLMDISMPGRSGLGALREVKQERPALPVLVLSVHPEEQCGARALQLGAAGYLTKDSAPGALVEAIRKAVPEGRYLRSDLAEQLTSRLIADTGQPHHRGLSEREYQILCMIGSGKTNTEIARELALSVKSVSTYRIRILGKMAMRTTAELMHYAISHRLVMGAPQKMDSSRRGLTRKGGNRFHGSPH
jgi:two-component system, NarL family, invasion response regulator UvrY